jgi:hypothetical protein
LLLDTCLARFDGAAWTTTHPVAVFDSVFVAENVHSGDAVEIDHKRNLYRVIIGDDGVQLAEEDARLAGESRAKTSEMSAAANHTAPCSRGDAIRQHCPGSGWCRRHCRGSQFVREDEGAIH